MNRERSPGRDVRSEILKKMELEIRKRTDTLVKWKVRTITTKTFFSLTQYQYRRGAHYRCLCII